MSSAQDRHRNNVKTGVFVSTAIVLAVAILWILSGFGADLFRSSNVHTVVFPLASGVENLKRGAPVRVGGVELGRVTAVRPIYQPDRPLEEIEVEIRVDGRVTLYSDAVISVRSPLLGTEPWVEITNVGGGLESRSVSPRIAGAERSGMIDTMLGTQSADGVRTVIDRMRDEMERGDTLLAAVIGEESMDRLRGLIEESGRVMVNARELSEWMATLPDEYQLRIVPALDDAAASARSVRSVTDQLAEEQWPAWTSRFDLILSDVSRGVEDGAALLDDVRVLVADVSPGVRSAVDGVDTAVQRFNEETFDRLNAALAEMAGAVESAGSVVARIGDDYPQWSAYVEETLSRLALTAQQAQLASVEIRRSPWRILYRPGPKELEHELLYEAARSFALAAGDLRAAGGAVDRLLDAHGGALADDPELIERLTRVLGGPLERYEHAQRVLFDLLLEGAP